MCSKHEEVFLAGRNPHMQAVEMLDGDGGGGGGGVLTLVVG